MNSPEHFFTVQPTGAAIMQIRMPCSAEAILRCIDTNLECLIIQLGHVMDVIFKYVSQLFPGSTCFPNLFCSIQFCSVQQEPSEICENFALRLIKWGTFPIRELASSQCFTLDPPPCMQSQEILTPHHFDVCPGFGNALQSQALMLSISSWLIV